MKRLELSEFLPYRLSILSNLVSSAIASEYAAQFNLSISGWRIMASVALTPDISAQIGIVQRPARHLTPLIILLGLSC